MWLNGSQAAGGGPSAAYLFNRAAAQAEVAANPASNLNLDEINDPEAWGYRRHLRRTVQLGGAFARAFGAGSFGAIVRPALGWSQNFQAELRALGAWYDLALAPTYGHISSVIYGIAVNGYAVGGVLPGASEADIVAAVAGASDAQRAARAASAAIAAQGGLKLMTYEGALVCLPLGRDAATTGAVIAANRGAPWGAAMLRDFEANWAGVGGAEFNLFALASQYGSDLPPFSRYQWGLMEDVHNESASKYVAAVQMAGMV